MKNPLVSIIIPVYNVEKYLSNSVNSILKQQYNNIEILLVDDGSTDNSGKICNQLSKKDERIKVFHKKNGGLSDARNFGLKHSRGEYICFMDSDDTIPTYSIKLLMNILLKTKSDISTGQILETFEINYNDISSSNEIFYVYDAESALQEMLYLHSIQNSANGKIYKKSLFNGIKYPVGKYYEDLGTTYKIFDKASKIVCTQSIIYYYYQNYDGIMHKKYSKKRLDAYYFALEELEFIKNKHINIINAAIFRLYYECIFILNDMPYDAKDKQLITTTMKKYKKIVLHDKNLTKKQRLLCFSSILGQRIIKFVCRYKFNIKKLKHNVNKHACIEITKK